MAKILVVNLQDSPVRPIARKFDGSKHRAYPGRPRVDAAIKARPHGRKEFQLGLQSDCRGTGQPRSPISDQTIGTILKRHSIAPAPKRSQNTTWKDFIAAHMAVLAGTDFFTVEVLTWRGLVTY